MGKEPAPGAVSRVAREPQHPPPASGAPSERDPEVCAVQAALRPPGAARPVERGERGLPIDGNAHARRERQPVEHAPGRVFELDARPRPRTRRDLRLKRDALALGSDHAESGARRREARVAPKLVEHRALDTQPLHAPPHPVRVAEYVAGAAGAEVARVRREIERPRDRRRIGMCEIELRE